MICNYLMFFEWCGVDNMVDKVVHYLMCKVGVYYFTRKALC